MNNSNKNSNNDEALLRELEKASPEEFKTLILNSIPEQCRTLAGQFFNCVEEKVQTINTTNNLDVENQLDKVVIPECTAKFDFESCINKMS